MKYIPGTKFINNTTKNTKFFKHGICYTLFNIKKNDTTVEYTFKKDDKTLHNVKFKNVEEADEYLQTIAI